MNWQADERYTREWTMYTVPIETNRIPEQAQYLLRDIESDGFIGGGYARWVWLRDEMNVPDPGDIDLFCRTAEAFDTISVKLVRKLGYVIDKELVNAVQYRHLNPDWLPVQLILPHSNEFIKMYGEPEFVLTNFDYTINMAALLYDRDNGCRIVLGDDMEEANARKLLVINHINCPVALASRAVKYAKKGYHIGIGELAKLFVEWERRPKEYRRRVAELAESGEDREELYRMLRVD
jgi:hypothetical protein